MKQLLSLVLAGVIGGLITLGGLHLLPEQADLSSEKAQHATTVKQVNVAPNLANVPFDFTKAAEKSMPAVVHISSVIQTASSSNRGNDPFRFFFGDDLFGPQQGSGSGVIYSQDGYIITNNHVVKGAETLEVTLYDNRTFTAKLIGIDEKTDLAVIKIEASDLPNIGLGNSDNAKVGEWVLAVGNPFDLTSTVTAGIISAKGRSINLLGGGNSIESFIQTDAAVNPGNSGGALVDTEGNLLGINTAIATNTGTFSGYSFAIPVNLVTRIVDDIIEYGSFQRAFLGVIIAELDNEYAEQLGVNITQGVVIEELVDGGSAQFAGLQPKDVITGINGKDVKSVPELQEIVGRAKVGDTLDVQINRRGNIQKIPVKLKASGL